MRPSFDRRRKSSSSTPLMNGPEFSLPNFLPRSMASLMETLGGMSPQKSNSKMARRRMLRSRRRPSAHRFRRDDCAHPAPKIRQTAVPTRGRRNVQNKGPALPPASPSTCPTGRAPGVPLHAHGAGFPSALLTFHFPDGMNRVEYFGEYCRMPFPNTVTHNPGWEISGAGSQSATYARGADHGANHFPVWNARSGDFLQ
jgi:hypothetical protein